MFCIVDLFGEYRIDGKVNLSDSWQAQVFLAAVHRLDDYYKANPDLIIQSVPVNADGTFTLSGDNLPLDLRFYRLYLIKEQNSEFDACLYVGGEEHNFIHLLLNNDSEVNVLADPSQLAPFGDYTVIGGRENALMKQLAEIVFPSFYFFQIKFPTDLRFSMEKMNRELVLFADTCSHSLVSLAALNNTDMDQYYLAHNEIYKKVNQRLKTDFKESPYIKEFSRKLKYYADEKPIWTYFIIGALFASCLGLLGLSRQNKKLKKELLQLSNQVATPAVDLDQLTRKELDIFKAIIQGKSNKEIASEFFVELSTVKTHINKLYQKLAVNSRQEAINIGQKIL